VYVIQIPKRTASRPKKVAAINNRELIAKDQSKFITNTRRKNPLIKVRIIETEVGKIFKVEISSWYLAGIFTSITLASIRRSLHKKSFWNE
jgi:hypothetical protein